MTSTTTLQLDKELQILEISKNITDCKVIFTVTTENDVPFEFNVVDEKNLDEGTYELKTIDSGYVSGTANNVKGPTYLVLTSSEPCKATVTYECIKNSTTPQRPVNRKRPVAATNFLQPTQSTLTPVSNVLTDVPQKFYKKKGFIIGVVIILAVLGFWYFKRSRKGNKPQAPAGATTLKDPSPLQLDPTNEESSFGF